MDTAIKLFNDITSWYWWFSVVLVGFGINLASAYIKPSIDKWYERRSERKRLSSYAERVAFKAKVGLLATDPLILVIEALEELRERTRFLFFFVAALFLSGLSIAVNRVSPTHSPFQLFLALFFMISSLFAFAQALSLLRSTAKRAGVITAAKKALLLSNADVAQSHNPPNAAR